MCTTYFPWLLELPNNFKVLTMSALSNELITSLLNKHHIYLCIKNKFSLDNFGCLLFLLFKNTQKCTTHTRNGIVFVMAIFQICRPKISAKHTNNALPDHSLVLLCVLAHFCYLLHMCKEPARSECIAGPVA